MNLSLSCRRREMYFYVPSPPVRRLLFLGLMPLQIMTMEKETAMDYQSEVSEALETSSNASSEFDENSSTEKDWGEDDEYPLHEAAACGDIRTIERLLNKGQEDFLFSRDEMNRTPLDIAAQSGQIEVVNKILVAGSIFDQESFQAMVNDEDEVSHTLLWRIQDDQNLTIDIRLKIMELLLHYGASLSINRCNTTGIDRIVRLISYYDYSNRINGLTGLYQQYLKPIECKALNGDRSGLEQLAHKNPDLLVQTDAIIFAATRGDKLMVKHILASSRFHLLEKLTKARALVSSITMYRNEYIDSEHIENYYDIRDLLENFLEDVLGEKSVYTSYLPLELRGELISLLTGNNYI